MKDKILSIIVGLITISLIFVVTREFFLSFAKEYKLAGGFIKFFFLASIGDFISIRLRTKQWSLPKNILLKATVWGLIGIVIVLIFGIFSSGVDALQASSILPFKDSNLARAFFISLIMNATFAPTMMAFHRITDTYLDAKYDKRELRFIDTVSEIDWTSFFKIVIVRTIPLFWIPAHTITFILPTEYQVIFAAILGIFLGLLLGLFGKKK